MSTALTAVAPPTATSTDVTTAVPHDQPTAAPANRRPDTPAETSPGTPAAAPTEKPARMPAGGSAKTAVQGTVAPGVRVRRRGVLRLAVVLGVVAMLCVASAPVSTPAVAQEAGVVVLAQAESIDQLLTNIRSWLMGILAGLATVMATVGGIRYTMADGDPGEIQRAKTAFRSAGIGFALAALAPLLVTVLQGVVGL
jgi:type IV secretion system pilin